MEDQGLGTLPPQHHLDALEAFFFNNVYPLLPVVDEHAHRQEPIGHPARVLRSQGMCLLASMNFSVASHLCVPGSDRPVSHADFGRKMFAAMRISLEMAFVTDKLGVIRAWTMMSLYSSGQSSQEQTSHTFARAVQAAYTAGLHLKGRGGDEDARSRLYCCVWVVDRLRAAIHGRPILMHDADMAKSPLDCVSALQPSFAVFVNVGVLLNKVIGLYRPGSQSFEIPDQDFPPFEDILRRCNAVDSQPHLLSKYHMSECMSERWRTLLTSLIGHRYIRAVVSCGRHAFLPDQSD